MNKQKIDLYHIISYFTIFSIIGLFIETIFCYITTGIIECRKGLIWGPFCPIYGIGAVVLILMLQQYKEHSSTLFIYGCILGNIIEYLMSFILEAIYGSRFWDYSYIVTNLNGRVCIKYSLFWGILSIILVKYVQTWINKLIEKFSIVNKNKLCKGIIIFFIIDSIATVWSIKSYQRRILTPEKIPTITIQKRLEEILFPIEYIKTTFPNLRYIDDTGKEHYLKEKIETK